HTITSNDGLLEQRPIFVGFYHTVLFRRSRKNRTSSVTGAIAVTISEIHTSMESWDAVIMVYTSASLADGRADAATSSDTACGTGPSSCSASQSKVLGRSQVVTRTIIIDTAAPTRAAT